MKKTIKDPIRWVLAVPDTSKDHQFYIDPYDTPILRRFAIERELPERWKEMKKMGWRAIKVKLEVVE